MFIDTNIFLEIFLKDKNYVKCEEFIRRLTNKKISFYTSDFIIFSCLLIIKNKLKSTTHMKGFLIFINSIKIEIIRPSLKEMYGAIEFMKKYRLDFDDALIISCMVENNIKSIISYDKHFIKVKEIDVVEP
ncbi:type II toxin-antitoxin system VapC family toxin [Candidatus Woesearchaeota archaeon]|nr:type II toxin-antitoxin system VapC family toxin [Candidatus Woesearchaeota archaeon]